MARYQDNLHDDDLTSLQTVRHPTYYLDPKKIPQRLEARPAPQLLPR